MGRRDQGACTFLLKKPGSAVLDAKGCPLDAWQTRLWAVPSRWRRHTFLCLGRQAVYLHVTHSPESLVEALSLVAAARQP